MKKQFRYLVIVLAMMTSSISSHGQATTAMDFNGPDCNGNSVHLFSDLDSGKAVILFYYMPSCGACPPPAQKIQTMANHINAMHPGMVKAYAFPYINTTTCAYSQTWVTSNSLPLYAPMDSGATAVAYYGGFGMPTVVLVGGASHRVMFTTMSFSTSDTTIMRDSILALLGSPSGIERTQNIVCGVELFPNPATNQVMISFDLRTQSNLAIDVLNVTGERVLVIEQDRKSSGKFRKEFNTGNLPNGIYSVRINTDGNITTKKLHINH